MRRLLDYSLALCLVATIVVHARAADSEAARAILDKAIQSHGGPDQLAKTKVLTRSTKGKIIFGGREFPFTGEASLSFPDRGRWSFDLDAGGAKVQMVVVMNGTRGWRVGGGMTKELSEGELQEIQEEAYVAWVMTLAPLKDKAFELEPLPETKVNGQAVVGITVARKDRPNVKLYFDKQTHLLVKAERRGKEAGLPALKEAYLSEFKEFEGVKLPTRVLETTEGKKAAEWSATTYKFPNKLDDSMFAKP